MAKVIKEIDWNGHHYTFTNTYKNTGTKSHDILTMEDENGNSWVGETTWINRPWHRFDLEEAFTEIVSKAFGPKATELILEINKNANSVENAIDNFFANFKLEDIQASSQSEKSDTSSEARLLALAKYLEVEPEEVEEIGENEFSVNGDTYRVLTDEEADYEFDERVRSLWDELGLDEIGDNFRDYVLENCVDTDQLEDLVREDISDYVYNMGDEEVADECIDEGIVESEEVYDEESDEWSPELRDDVDFDDLREQLIDEKFNQVDDYVEYFKDLGYDAEFFKDYIDEEAVIDALKDDIDVNGGGRGQELSWVNGEEIELDNGFYAYQVD